jgi:radical SAM-linked protein
VSNETILLVIRFKIGGSLRFLSHAETLKLFQRACVRAGINMQYSRGFNPRPKMSLPLPRTVAVASDDDLLCLRVNRDPSEPPAADYASRVRDELSSRLPKGCELRSVEVAQAGAAYHPTSATYVLTMQAEHIDGKTKERIEHLLSSDSLNLQRRMGAKKSGFKNVDVRPFVKSIELGDREIVVECKISSAGTIRVNEILELLELDEEKLTAPIRRTNVNWQVSGS